MKVVVAFAVLTSTSLLLSGCQSLADGLALYAQESSMAGTLPSPVIPSTPPAATSAPVAQTKTADSGDCDGGFATDGHGNALPKPGCPAPTPAPSQCFYQQGSLVCPARQ
jgi:hypothetical protein